MAGHPPESGGPSEGIVGGFYEIKHDEDLIDRHPGAPPTGVKSDEQKTEHEKG
jgi:hypothetical protein